MTKGVCQLYHTGLSQEKTTDMLSDYMRINVRRVNFLMFGKSKHICSSNQNYFFLVVSLIDTLKSEHKSVFKATSSQNTQKRVSITMKIFLCCSVGRM